MTTVTEPAEDAPPIVDEPATESSAAGPTFGRFTGWRQLLLLVGSFVLVVGISSVLAWRISPAPDEDSHKFMITHQANNLSPVGWQDMEWGIDRGHSYYLYSSIPYYIYAPFERLQEAIGPVDSAARPDRVITRIGGALVFGATQLALTLLIVRRMRKDFSNEMVILVALAANLLPQLRYQHAYLNTDSFTILAATACFALALRLWQRSGVGLVDALLVGGAFAAVAHGRYNGFAGAAVLAGVFGVCVFRRSEGVRVRLRLIGLALAIPVLLAAPVHLAIYNELRNDHVIASTDHDQMARSTFSARIPATPTLDDQISAWFDDAGFTWQSTFSSIQGYSELAEPWIWVFALLCVAGTAGLVLRRPELLTGSGRAIGLLAVGCTLGTWLLMVAWPYHLGRFLLPAAATALAAIILGSGVLLQRFVRARGFVIAVWVWVALFGLLDVMAIVATAPA